jgi:hypothetical protein
MLFVFSTGGCLAHKTGVACGALMMYLRYLVDPGPLDMFAPHNFFPEGSRGLLGDEVSNKKMMSVLEERMHRFDDKEEKEGDEPVAAGWELGGQDKQNDNNEEEEEEDDEEEYYSWEVLYPVGGGGGEGQPQPPHDVKVVHFGAGNDKDKDSAGKDKQPDKDEYVDEKEEEEEEEGDYIKRVKGDDNSVDDIANNKDDEHKDDDTEYTYYDDDDENTDRGIIRKHKPQAPPQNGPRIRSHARHKTHPHESMEAAIGQPELPPTKMIIFLLSATSLVLLIFIYKFMKKRRIHLKYRNRFLKM